MSEKRYQSLSALAVAYAFAEVPEGRELPRKSGSVCVATIRSARAERIATHDSGTMLAVALPTTISVSTLPAPIGATSNANTTPTLPAPRSCSSVPTVPAPPVRIEIPTLPVPGAAAVSGAK